MMGLCTSRRTAKPSRYKLPSGFHKAVVLFNLHRALGAAQDRRRLVVVEEFFDCMKIAQAGVLNVVALMGCTLSEALQKRLIPFREVLLMLDGDKAGKAASAEIAACLVHQSFVRVIDVAGQPDQLSSDEIRATLGAL